MIELKSLLYHSNDINASFKSGIYLEFDRTSKMIDDGLEQYPSFKKTKRATLFFNDQYSKKMQRYDNYPDGVSYTQKGPPRYGKNRSMLFVYSCMGIDKLPFIVDVVASSSAYLNALQLTGVVKKAVFIFNVEKHFVFKVKRSKKEKKENTEHAIIAFSLDVSSNNVSILISSGEKQTENVPQKKTIQSKLANKVKRFNRAQKQTIKMIKKNKRILSTMLHEAECDDEKSFRDIVKNLCYVLNDGMFHESMISYK